jgi:SNF2 family DNA or RNA helicase
MIFKPFAHQERAREIVVNEGHDKYALYLDTGTGKTLASLYLINSLPDHLRWQVITPKSVIESWLNDAAEYFPHLDIATVASYKDKKYYNSIFSGSIAQVKERIKKETRIVLVNPELVIPKTLSLQGEISQKNAFIDVIQKYGQELGAGLYHIPTKEHGLRFLVEKLKSQKLAKEEEQDLFLLKDFREPKKKTKKVKGFVDWKGFDGLIFDESARLRDPKSSISKLCHEFSDHAKHVFLLSGEPAPNSELEFFSQMRCVDPSLFGKSDWEFKQRYAYQDKFKGWHIKEESRKEIMRLVKTKSIFVSKRDVLKDLPPYTEIDRYIVEDKATKERRLELQKILMGDAFTVGQLMPFRTVCAGFLYERDVATGEKTGKVIHLNYAKRDLLMETLQEIGDKKVIVWVQFDADVDRIMEALGRANTAIATGRSKKLQNELNDFMGRKKYLIAHPKSIGEGVNGLQKVCSYSISYTMSYSHDEHYQLISRLLRNRQKEPVTHFNLVVKDSIEELMLAAVKEKQSLQEYIRENLDWKNK